MVDDIDGKSTPRRRSPAGADEAQRDAEAYWERRSPTRCNRTGLIQDASVGHQGGREMRASTDASSTSRPSRARYAFDKGSKSIPSWSSTSAAAPSVSLLELGEGASVKPHRDNHRGGTRTSGHRPPGQDLPRPHASTCRGQDGDAAAARAAEKARASCRGHHDEHHPLHHRGRPAAHLEVSLRGPSSSA